MGISGSWGSCKEGYTYGNCTSAPVHATPDKAKKFSTIPWVACSLESAHDREMSRAPQMPSWHLVQENAVATAMEEASAANRKLE